MILKAEVDTGADRRRRIPRTDVLLADPRLAAARSRLGDEAVKHAVRVAQGRARTAVLTAAQRPEPPCM